MVSNTSTIIHLLYSLDHKYSLVSSNLTLTYKPEIDAYLDMTSASVLAKHTHTLYMSAEPNDLHL